MIYKLDKEELSYKNITLKASLIIVLIIIVFTAAITVFALRNINEVRFISQETKTIIINEKYEFSKEKLKEYILELNLKFPHIVLAQAQLESEHFKSPIFKENNNFFGMKCATLRPTTNKGENRGHAYFDSWRDCVVDYAFFQARFLSQLKTEKEYLDYLGENYAEDPNYVQKLKKMMKFNEKENK